MEASIDSLSDQQLDAMAETLWDFAWNDDPNSPHCFKRFYKDASKTARDYYRSWAKAIHFAGETGESQHVYGQRSDGRPWSD